MTAPLIHAGSPLQRDGSNLVDVPYRGYSADSNLCTLVVAEYSLTGEFAGEEQPCTPAVSDPEHDGTALLAFVPGGADLNFVWDAEADLGNDGLSDVAQMRLRAAYGEELSSYSTSAQFSLDTRESTDDVDAPAFSRGTTAQLRIYLVDRDGDAFDPEDLELSSVTDPSGTEQIYEPVEATKLDYGLWCADFEVPSDGELGVWTATWSYTGEVAATRESQFLVNSGIKETDPLGGTDTCLVRGRLMQADGLPLTAAEVKFIPTHLSDPELLNPTDISEGVVTIVTDSDGRFVMELIRNTEGILYIEELGFRQAVQVPDLDTCQYRDMPVTLPTGTRDKFGNRVAEDDGSGSSS